MLLLVRGPQAASLRPQDYVFHLAFVGVAALLLFEGLEPPLFSTENFVKVLFAVILVLLASFFSRNRSAKSRKTSHGVAILPLFPYAPCAPWN